MSKTQAVRAALADLSAGEDLDIAGIRAATSDPSIAANHIKCMIKSGEVLVSGSGRKHRYRLNSNHTTTRQRNAEHTLPIKRRKKKPARKATKKRSARIRKIAEAITTAPPLSRLALQQLIAASSLLRATVTNQVDGLDTNPLLTGALQNAERAESLAEAA